MARRRSVARTEQASLLHLDGQPVDCLLRRSSARRTMALRVDTQGRVVVNAPLRLPEVEINRFIFRHSEWLKDQLARQNCDQLRWTAGMTLPFLGRELTLQYQVNLGQARIQDDILWLPAGGLPLESVTAWYRGQAALVLAHRLATICARLGRETPSWRLSSARTRWGSLSPKGLVSLNWRLVKASPAVIDYVICHELAHFRQRNHSPAFWREVAAICPGFDHARARLRENSRLYFQF